MKRPPESLSSPTAVIASTEGVRVYSGRIEEPICACRLTAATKPERRHGVRGVRLAAPQVADASVLQPPHVRGERLRSVPHADGGAELHDQVLRIVRTC